MDGRPRITRREALRRAGMVAGAAVAGSALTGCASYLDSAGASSKSRKAPVLLGIIDPYTGPFAAAGTSQTQGCELAVAEINRAGGVLGGRPVEIRKRDDATKADVGARGARELIQQEGVDVIVGMASSAVALAVSEACAQLGCPLVVSGAHDDTITGTSAHRTTFRVNTGSVMVARVVVEPLMKKTGNRWFFITSDYAYGLGAEKAMIAELTRRGGTVVATEHTPLGTTDYSAQLTKARGSGATTLVLVLFGADLIAASKQYDEFGLRLGLGGHVHSLEMAVGIGADRLHGIYGTSWNVDVDTEGTRRFVEAIRQRTGQTANSRHYYGYLAAREALEAIDRAGTTDTEEWVKAMEGHRFDTLKQREGYWRDWDHQAMHDSLAIEAIPPSEWEFENQYFKTIGVGDAEKIALSREENRAGPERIQHEKVVARAGYHPKDG